MEGPIQIFKNKIFITHFIILKVSSVNKEAPLATNIENDDYYFQQSKDSPRATTIAMRAPEVQVLKNKEKRKELIVNRFLDNFEYASGILHLVACQLSF